MAPNDDEKVLRRLIIAAAIAVIILAIWFSNRDLKERGSVVKRTTPATVSTSLRTTPP